MQKKFQLLAKLGEAAFQRYKLPNGKWMQAPISARYKARLRVETIKAGGEWNYDAEPKKSPFDRQLKGHKHVKLKALREENIAKNMAEMDDRIAAWREKKKKEYTWFDTVTMKTRQLRIKYRDTAK
mmetsp:Transcript_39130/g.124556  ORF Transcript_39130/g.124556 Transcript_39130/m.124556 type:complete len:126 (+) Transcript_39130:1292-1669(+)